MLSSSSFAIPKFKAEVENVKKTSSFYTVKLKLNIPSNTYVYLKTEEANELTIEPAEDSDITKVKIIRSPSGTKVGSDVVLKGIQYFTLKIYGNLRHGTVKLTVNYQLCDASTHSCYFPDSVDVTIY